MKSVVCCQMDSLALSMCSFRDWSCRSNVGSPDERTRYGRHRSGCGLTSIVERCMNIVSATVSTPEYSKTYGSSHPKVGQQPGTQDSTISRYAGRPEARCHGGDDPARRGARHCIGEAARGDLGMAGVDSPCLARSARPRGGNRVPTQRWRNVLESALRLRRHAQRLGQRSARHTPARSSCALKASSCTSFLNSRAIYAPGRRTAAQCDPDRIVCAVRTAFAPLPPTTAIRAHGTRQDRRRAARTSRPRRIWRRA